MTTIPKKIHYIWIGGNPKPQIVLDCIESWKKYMPDYEIIEWNEDNYDVNKNDYMRQAYAHKKWAFVSDYMRFDILYNYGGIYVDTDVEFIKKIPDDILIHESFTGMESAGSVNPGLIYGCKPGDSMAKAMIESYQISIFNVENPITVNVRITNILMAYGFEQNDKFQIINGLAIYPAEFFCGYDQDVKEIYITKDTISVHHYAGTWTKRTKKQVARTYLKKIFGVEGYRKILMFYRKVAKK